MIWAWRERDRRASGQSDGPDKKSIGSSTGFEGHA